MNSSRSFFTLSRLSSSLLFSSFLYYKYDRVWSHPSYCSGTGGMQDVAKNDRVRYPEAGYPFFRVGCTLNPMYEKRWKLGEDAYVIAQGNFEDWRTAGRETFICVMDGVGGWQRRLVDAGKFTKEMAKHIKEIYVNEYTGYPGKEHAEGSEIRTLKDILD